MEVEVIANLYSSHLSELQFDGLIFRDNCLSFISVSQDVSNVLPIPPVFPMIHGFCSSIASFDSTWSHP